MKLLALLFLLLAMPSAARELARVEDPELATVLGLQHELGTSSPRSEQPYFVRVFSVPVGVYECGGSVESCPDVRLFVTVSFGDLGETPALFELPAKKGWQFVGWLTPSGSGDERMASFSVRTTLPETNIDPEARRAWSAEQYLVLVSPGSASYVRR
jgi:hypothetical protein